MDMFAPLNSVCRYHLSYNSKHYEASYTMNVDIRYICLTTGSVCPKYLTIISITHDFKNASRCTFNALQASHG